MSDFLGYNAVCERLGVRRVTVWRWIRAGKFPQPVALGEKRVAFRRHDVDAWISARVPVDYATGENVQRSVAAKSGG